jgi:hypothetical protein
MSQPQGCAGDGANHVLLEPRQEATLPNLIAYACISTTPEVDHEEVYRMVLPELSESSQSFRASIYQRRGSSTGLSALFLVR